jgi:hypothetical protein
LLDQFNQARVADYHERNNGMTAEERAEAMRPILEWCDALEAASEGEESLKSVTARMLALKDKYTLLVRFVLQ